jgi:hypothetical protein
MRAELIRVGVLFALIACTRHDYSICNTNSECTDPSRPVCDLNGKCVAPPDAATLCAPNAALSCTGNELSVCSADGNSMMMETCALGCASQPRCLGFQPMNGLGGALSDSANQLDVSLPPGTRIDTSAGLVVDAAGNPIPVKTATVLQAGGPAIFVLEARSFTIADTNVIGANAIAFVAPGAITITGRLGARGYGTSTQGPGAQIMGACVSGPWHYVHAPCVSGGPLIAQAQVGTGGGGNAVKGGIGGGGGTGFAGDGGAAQPGFSPLVGGCRAGAQTDPDPVVVQQGGGGGGAIQIDTLTSISVIGAGLIDIGGGGGDIDTGGGAGGLVILEAPRVTVSGASAGIAANGGAGGGCGAKGADSMPNASPAVGAICANNFGGSGGTGSLSPTSGCRAGVDVCMATCPSFYGGGGGSVGRARIATKDGTYATTGGPILSVAITTATLVPQ